MRKLANEGHCGYLEPGVIERTTKLIEVEPRSLEGCGEAYIFHRDRAAAGDPSGITRQIVEALP
jgi:hypothetical protein